MIWKLAVILMLATAVRGTAQIWTLNPVADAFVTTGTLNTLAGNNYGGAGALGISGADASKGLFDSVLLFDLASAKSQFDTLYGVGLWSVQSITLKLTATNPANPIFNAQSTGQFAVTWMQDDSWIEGGGNPGTPDTTTPGAINYNNLPDFLGAGDQAAGTFAFDQTVEGLNGAVATYTLTLGSGLTGDVLGGNLASLHLSAASDSVSYLFNSRSFGTVGSRPLLTITAVPEPSVLTLLGLAAWGAIVTRRRRRED